MNNDLCFLDSSIFIENFKGNIIAKFLLIEAIDVFGYTNCYINGIVFSEVVYKLLGIISQKSPLSLKKKKEIGKILSSNFIKPHIHLIKLVKTLEINDKIIKNSLDLMIKYNLLPNDALILATCKYYNIPYLLSLDEDFKEACEKEGIVLIDSVEKLKEVLNKK